jgi:hypothetical protein
MFKFNKRIGQASRLLLVLAVVVLFAVIITFLILKMAEKPPAPKPAEVTTIPIPVYEKQLGDIDFVFETSIDKGGVLKASEALNNKYGTQKDFVISNLGAKFILVTVGAKNVGTMNTDKGSWDVENIVDSKNREFVPLTISNVKEWLPAQDLCGSLLKPAFDPTPCSQIYEVSKESSGLRIRVIAKKNVTSSGKDESALLDLIVK